MPGSSRRMPAPLSGLTSESQPGMSLIRTTAGAVHPNLVSLLVFSPGLITAISTALLIPTEHRINHDEQMEIYAATSSEQRSKVRRGQWLLNPTCYSSVQRLVATKLSPYQKGWRVGGQEAINDVTAEDLSDVVICLWFSSRGSGRMFGGLYHNTRGFLMWRCCKCLWIYNGDKWGARL